MFTHPRVALKRRDFITALPLYYSGHLLKKHKKEKHFKRYHAELRGATLLLYQDERQDTYVEKLDLEGMTSMELNSSDKKKKEQSFVIFTLRLHTDEVQLKMDNYNTGEEWKRYILTVIKKKIPSELHLLPGQVLQLQEVLNQEKIRILSKLHPPLPPRPSFLLMSATEEAERVDDHDLPTCFLPVTREEAEQILEDNPEHGSIILRPSTLTKNYALTLRQLTPSGPVIKHYRISFTNSAYVIELRKPVSVFTLNEVIDHFMEMTEYRLYPYLSTQAYNTNIDSSNGFSTPTSPTVPTQPSPPVAPMHRLHPEDLTPPTPTKPVGDEYMIPDVQSPEADKVLMHEELLEALKRWTTIGGSAVDEEVVENTYTKKTPNRSSMTVSLTM